MMFRTWPGMAGGLLTLLLCGCQSANWFALNREQREPPGAGRFADRRDDARSKSGESSDKTAKEAGVKIARTESGAKNTSSKTPAEWYTEGARLETERRYSDARVAYEHAIEADPAFAEAHHRLGVIADRAGEFALADRHYNRAHELKPSDPSILSDMGYSQYLRKHDREAERLLKQAVELEPQHVDANGNLAQVYVRQKRYDDALAALSKIESPDSAREKLAGMLPPGAPAIDQIAERETPASVAGSGEIQRVVGNDEMSRDQARWLEEQMSAPAGEIARAAEQKVIHAGGVMEGSAETSAEASAPAGRAQLPTIEPLAGIAPKNAAPQARPLVAEAGESTRPAPPDAGGFWQGTPLPTVEAGAPRTPQTLAATAGPSATDAQLPRATITDVTPRSEIVQTGGTTASVNPDRTAAIRLAALAGFDTGPGSLFPTGATVPTSGTAGNPQALGMASPWGNPGTTLPGQSPPAWPGREQPTSGAGVIQAGGTLADWPAASMPVSGTQPREADPLAAFQHEIDQRAAADSLPAPPAQPGSALRQPAAGSTSGLSPWPSPSASATPSAGASPLAAQMNGTTRPGTAQAWPPRPQTLQKPIATTSAAPPVAWPSPQPTQPLPVWPSNGPGQ